MLHDEVDAIRNQLKLLGHSVPTDVIVSFLQNNNELFSLEAAASGINGVAQSRSSAQPPEAMYDNVQAPLIGPTLRSNESPLARPSTSQSESTPQLDITWAGKDSWSVSAASQKFVSRCLCDATAAPTAVPAGEQMLTAALQVQNRLQQNPSNRAADYRRTAQPCAGNTLVLEPFVPEPFVPEPFVPEPFVPEPFVPEPFIPEPSNSSAPHQAPHNQTSRYAAATVNLARCL